ncbi:hypothetical protein LTR86_007086 [Recurvomyces mirabilis]|nr:hypothetical protein LTR86_007086 [Recurvomyces mirabilis]
MLGQVGGARESSRLFDMPPELRIIIYAHVFSMDHGTAIDLVTAYAPSKTLLMTCKTIAIETDAAYRAERYKFWGLNTFVLGHGYGLY